MEKLNVNDFLYSGGQYYEWFLKEDFDAEIAARCRQLLNENVFTLNWRTSVGVTLDWKYVNEDLKGAHIVKDYGKYKSVFLDFMDSKLPKGCENNPENYSVLVFNDSVNKLFWLSHKAVITYWNAGWPRHGWNPGRYVIEPWELFLYFALCP